MATGGVRMDEVEVGGRTAEEEASGAAARGECRESARDSLDLRRAAQLTRLIYLNLFILPRTFIAVAVLARQALDELIALGGNGVLLGRVVEHDRQVHEVDLGRLGRRGPRVAQGEDGVEELRRWAEVSLGVGSGGGPRKRAKLTVTEKVAIEIHPLPLANSSKCSCNAVAASTNSIESLHASSHLPYLVSYTPPPELTLVLANGALKTRRTNRVIMQ